MYFQVLKNVLCLPPVKKNKQTNKHKTKLHKHCFLFGMTVIPRRSKKTNVIQNFGGQTRFITGDVQIVN